jgi:hypothetical protein
MQGWERSITFGIYFGNPKTVTKCKRLEQALTNVIIGSAFHCSEVLLTIVQTREQARAGAFA